MDQFQEKSENEEHEIAEKIPRRNIRKLPQIQKPCATKLVIKEEEPHEEDDECDGNDQYDDETASKGSKESDNGKVIDTMYDKERDENAAAPVKNQMIRRKSMAPPVLHE